MEKNITPMLFLVEPEAFWERLTELIRAELKRENSTRKVPTSYEVPGLTQKPLYKSTEVCEMMSISRQTLHCWVKDGILRAYKIKSRLFFLRSDIDELLKKDPK